MPIPALTADGYLPVGAFDCDLAEIETAFGLNNHRVELLTKLRAFLTWLRDQHQLELPYYVDGSYTTTKPNPADIDFVLDISAANPQQVGAAVTLFTLYRQHIKDTFSIDFWFYHPRAQKDLRSFFQYVRVEELQQKQLPPSTRKGILRVQP